MVESESTWLLGGRYQLGEVLGRGGVATVYEAVDLELDRPVAVKCFRLGSSPSSLHRFGVEARLLANLAHPGLVTVHDVSLDGDQPYLVMRLVTGATLREVLDEGPLAPKAVAGIGARLADVFAYIHSRDVVHRDLKPSNVLIDESGQCYLTDFGLARALADAHVTPSGDLVGTAAYLAPEQVSEAGAGPEGDVYSLGLVLLECLSGKPEYTGTTAEAAIARLTRRPRVPPSLGSGWRTVLTAMTERNPADRPTAARCAELLDDLANGRVPRLFRRRHGRVGLAAAVLALAAALVILAVVVSVAVPRPPAGEAKAPPPEARPPVGLAAPLRAAETAVTAAKAAPADATVVDSPVTSTQPPPPPITSAPPVQQPVEEQAWGPGGRPDGGWGGRGGGGGRHGGRGR